MKVVASPSRSLRKRQQPAEKLGLERLEMRELLSGSPYVIPTAPTIDITPILTVGDSVPQTGGGTYRMVGIPDGTGAFDNGDGTFTVLMNHELPNNVGVPRDHHGTDPAGKGAFVSRWVIDKSTLTVLEGDDLIKTLNLWDSDPLSPTYNQYVVGTGALSYLNRLCSADLPAPTAFYNPATGHGTTELIFMNGEETGNGRAFAHVVTGADAGGSWELPWAGKYAWENHVTSPFAQEKTIVVGLDDSLREFSSEGAPNPSEVFVWVGNKQSSGLDIEKAGLVDGTLYGIRVGTPGSCDANESTVVSGDSFELFALSDQTNNTTFAPLQAESIANSITQFRRVEDGAWDPNSPNDFYFVTTDRFGATGFSKLWRLRFDDITNPEGGGTIELLINGNGVGSNSGFGTGEMFDNITVDNIGRVLLQEDVGNQTHLGKIWVYDIASGATLELARLNPAFFIDTNPTTPGVQSVEDLNPNVPGNQGTQDEESSGIIDLSHVLGDGYYLLDVQAHLNISATEPELVEAGQLLVMHAGATAGVGFEATTNGPALAVLGTRQSDHIEVEPDGATLRVRVGDQTLGTFSSSVDSVLVAGYDGNDHIDLSGVLTDSKIFGGRGNDHITAGSGDDFIYGGDGNDHINGGAGSDHLYGGDGNDKLEGGAGFDEVF